jgi:hypothetical protein
MEDRAASTIFIKHHVAACMEAILHDINQVTQIFTSFRRSLFLLFPYVWPLLRRATA